MIWVVLRATNPGSGFAEVQRTSFVLVHAVEILVVAAVGWLGKKPVVAAAAVVVKAVVIPRVYLVFEPACALPEPLADIAELKSLIVEVKVEA